MCTKLISKINSNYSVEPNGCWLWSGTTHSKWGYPQVSVGKFKYLVKRVMFEHRRQTIPHKHNVGTSCNNLLCINPKHLFLKLPATKAKKRAKQIAYEKNIPTTIDRFTTKYTVADSGCWLWTGWRHTNGYGGFSINDKSVLAHRASYMLLKGAIPFGLQVCHHCDVKRCVNPDHLFLGTQKDNIADMFAKGREVNPGAKGTANGSAKLFGKDIPVIRQKYERGFNSYELATEYGVNASTIQRIISGKNWSHVM